MKEVYPGDSVHSLLSILDVITVGFTHSLHTQGRCITTANTRRQSEVSMAAVSSQCPAADFSLTPAFKMTILIEPKIQILLEICLLFRLF